MGGGLRNPVSHALISTRGPQRSAGYAVADGEARPGRALSMAHGWLHGAKLLTVQKTCNVQRRRPDAKRQAQWRAGRRIEAVLVVADEGLGDANALSRGRAARRAHDLRLASRCSGTARCRRQRDGVPDMTRGICERRGGRRVTVTTHASAAARHVRHSLVASCEPATAAGHARRREHVRRRCVCQRVRSAMRNVVGAHIECVLHLS